jgi:hypothetical protein
MAGADLMRRLCDDCLSVVKYATHDVWHSLLQELYCFPFAAACILLLHLID